MGKGSGGGNSRGGWTFDSSLRLLQRKYGVDTNGKFGKRSNGSVRVLENSNPHKAAKHFYEVFSRAGSAAAIEPGSKYKVTFKGSKNLVIYRKTSRSGGPVIEIIDEKGQRQKIHFVAIGHK